jgi:6-phosphogluconolactonase
MTEIDSYPKAMLTFLTGSYTEYLSPDFGGTGRGIYTVQLNTETGALRPLHTEYVRNPSYLALSEDQRFLYCVTELDQRDDPKVKAFRVSDDFSLVFLNEQPIAGGYPCHLLVHEQRVWVACYATGNVLQFPLDAAGHLLPCAQNHQHSGSGVNPARQEGPHAHQVAVHPHGEDIYVCDLGIDTLKAYRLNGADLVPQEKKDCRVTAGGGPRHLVFNAEGSLAYVLNELTARVSVLQNQDGTFTEINSYGALPPGYEGAASGSAIRLHPNGRWLYAGNRQSDTIAIFKVEGNTLVSVGFQTTQGKELREFNLTPDGRWLIACHQNSHDTVVYEIQGDGSLVERFRTQEILSPVCAVFL